MRSRLAVHRAAGGGPSLVLDARRQRPRRVARVGRIVAAGWPVARSRSGGAGARTPGPWPRRVRGARGSRWPARTTRGGHPAERRPGRRGHGANRRLHAHSAGGWAPGRGRSGARRLARHGARRRRRGGARDGGAVRQPPQDVLAAVGPSIGPLVYEVGEEVRAAFAAEGHAPKALERWFRPGRASRPHLDVWQANVDQLVAVGVPAGQVACARACTATHRDWFFSHRGEGTATGRMVAAIRAFTPSSWR